MNNMNREEEVQMKEYKGRDIYSQWLLTKPECQHLYFTNKTFTQYDCLFLSAGTLCIADIKYRYYDSQFFDDYGAEVDRSKAAFLFKTAKALEAVPILLTATRDCKMIVSNINLAGKDDVRTEQRQKNDFSNDNRIITKKILNLKRCRIN